MVSNEFSENLKIKDVASILGVSRRTLRLYEEVGLIHPKKTAKGARLYDENDLDRMKCILRLKAVGMKLKEIEELAVLYNEEEDFTKYLPRENEVLDFHLEKIAGQLACLKGLKKELSAYRLKIKSVLSERSS